MFSSITLTVGLLAIFATQGLAEYISTCGRPYLIEDPGTKMPTLGSNCATKSGGAICTSLALNKCYVNLNGQLRGAIDGDYQNSCIDCHLEGELQTTLVCDCKDNDADGKEKYKSTRIDTNTNIYNADGLLSCYGYKGIECRT